MALAMTLNDYMVGRGIEYEVLAHYPTWSSAQTAWASQVAGHKIAKAVVLKDEHGYLLAVLPASRHIQFGELRRWLDRDVELATEVEIGALFADCEFGAVPAIGDAYGVDVLLDDNLVALPDIYFEGGDHIGLVHVSGDDFERMLPRARKGRFSREDSAAVH